MKINLRGRRAYLYRRRWVPAGPGVPHAHPAEDYLGAIDTNAESIPPDNPSSTPGKRFLPT